MNDTFTNDQQIKGSENFFFLDKVLFCTTNQQRKYNKFLFCFHSEIWVEVRQGQDLQMLFVFKCRRLHCSY
jgi:hypothetical protein